MEENEIKLDPDFNRKRSEVFHQTKVKEKDNTSMNKEKENDIELDSSPEVMNFHKLKSISLK